MAIFALGDPHLSHVDHKNMDIFGDHWKDHWQRIGESWRAQVSDSDLVLIPGDISWAMHLEDALVDLQAIASLPGQTLIMRGNHDFWWSSYAKVKAALPPRMSALQNNCFEYEGQAICGSRGWTPPGSSAFGVQDAKLFSREVGRLRLSLEAARDRGLPIRLCMMHYPPMNERQQPNEMTDLYHEFNISRVIFGHLHGRSLPYAFEGEHEGITYELVSCDHLHFAPKRLEFDEK